MGFGFNLFFISVWVPFNFILLILWLFTRKKLWGKSILFFNISLIIIISISVGISSKNTIVLLKKEDYYGDYVIYRDAYPGYQADWQYYRYKFTIKPNDQILFYETNDYGKTKIFKGKISTVKPHSSERLVIHMDSFHHITAKNPTVYRTTQGFYLVFHSSLFKNVFFQKKIKNRNLY